MNCPYCGGGLTKGKIVAPPQTFEFLPDGVKPRALRSRWARTKGAVKISDFEMFGKGSLRGYFYPAEYCARCRKIILDVPEADDRKEDY